MAAAVGGTGTGIGLATSTAIVWAISPLFMASVGRRIGSQNTNLLRALLASLFFAVLVLPIYWLMRGGVDWPLRRQCLWLMISGLVGMVIGDTCFYEALVRLGPRRAVKLNTLAPVVSLLVGGLVQREGLSQRSLAGAALVIGAVMYATFASAEGEEGENREPGVMSGFGLACGLLSAACIGLGSVTGRQAYRVEVSHPLDPIMATVVRVGFSAVALWIVAIARGAAGRALFSLKDNYIRTRIAWGTLLGPIVGMVCFVSALKFAPAGLVSTVISTSPLVILPVVAVKYGVKVRLAVVVALVGAVVGVGMICWE